MRLRKVTLVPMVRQRLRAGDNPAAQQCSWLEDRFGVSWQLVPVRPPRALADRDATRTGRVVTALLEMKPLAIAPLERVAAAARPRCAGGCEPDA